MSQPTDPPSGNRRTFRSFVERMGMSFVAVSISPLMSIFTTTEAAEIESSFGIGMKHEMVLFRFTVPWIYDEGQET